jgi:hypothetical protein
MIAGDIPKAKSHLSDLSEGVIRNFTKIVELIRLAHGGAEAIKREVYKLPELKIPDELPPHVRHLLAEHMTNLRLGGMLASVDAAGIVFAHAILDDLAIECCKVSATADPSAWEGALKKKEVSLSDLKARPFEEIYLRLLKQHLTRLAKESLSDRMDVLHQVCPPPSSRDVKFPSLIEMTAEDYKYDRDRIRAVDKIRQDIMHRVALDALAKSIEANPREMAYIERTCYYLLWIVDQKYQMGITGTCGLNSAQ